MKKQMMAIGALCLVLCAGVAQAAPILLKSGTIDPQGQSGRPKARLMAAGAPVAKGGLYIIQHEGAIPAGWRRQLRAAGARIRGYVPENAYIIEVPDEAYAKVEAVEHAYLGAYRAADRIEPTLQTGDEMICVISLFDAAARDAVRARLASVPGAEAIRADGKAIRARLSATARGTVAGWDEVEYISPYLAPKLYNDVAVGDGLMNVRTVWPNGGAGLDLSGTGQVVAVADTGLDTGDFDTLHRDLRGQVLRAYALARENDWSDRQGHGTHVSGSVLGTGAVSNDIRGVAWGAKLIMQSAGNASGQLSGLPADLNNLFRQAYEEENGVPGARIHSNSWGSNSTSVGGVLDGWYSPESRNVDEFTFSHPDTCVLFAAGNEGQDNLDPLGVVDGGSISSPSTAKNCIAVGASESFRPSVRMPWFFKMFCRYAPLIGDRIASPYDEENQGMAAFSSRGPCRDGRIKPDIVAPGTCILSTRARDDEDETGDYASKDGTSMATPLTAGASALVREWLKKHRGISNPDGATVKAVLMAGAKSLAPGQYGTGEYREIPEAYPNNVEGWGQVNVGRSVTNDAGIVVHDACVIGNGETHTYRVSVRETGRLAVVLAYADAPASLAASRQLVDDLDLEVKTPSGTTTYPNSLNGPDRVNNVEGVRFESAETGEYLITVKGTSINTPMDNALTGDRDDAIRYSLVVNGAEESAERRVSRTIYVGDGDSLQSAIDEAEEGDCIFVAEGNYAPIVNTNSGILVCAQDPKNPPIIDANDSGRCIRSVSGATFRGFTLCGGSASGVKGGGVLGGRLENCVITGCKATHGGGAACAELVNCLITDNEADVSGGGVYDCRLVNCTVVGNRADEARGAYLVGTDSREACALNCIIDKVGGEVSLYKRCFIGDDPGFGDDYHLAGGSPCIDAGYDGWVDMSTDLDGTLRIMGGAVDLGCYESLPKYGFADRDLHVSAPSQVVFVAVNESPGDMSIRSDCGWLVPQGVLNLGEGAISQKLMIRENETGASRTGHLELVDDDSKAILDTLTVTQVAATERGTYFALIVGGKANISLVQERCCSTGLWRPDNQRTITDEEGLTKAAVTEALGELAKTAKAGDMVLYYQSCPAEHDAEGCDPHSVRLRLGDDWMSPSELSEALSAFDKGVRVIVIVDASYSAGLFRGGASYGENIAFITAADCDQEIPAAADGAFTRTLCAEWASVAADVDNDARLDFLELWTAAARLADRPPDHEARCFNKTLLQGQFANIFGFPGLSALLRVDFADLFREVGPELALDMASNTMVMAGYSEALAGTLTTLDQARELMKWSATTGVTPAEVNEAAAPLLSAALWADGLLDISNESVRIRGFAPAATGLGWTLAVGLDAYDPRMLNKNLLQAAIGAVGSETADGEYTTSGLEQTVRPTEEHVEIDVLPPDDKDAYFLKGFVR